MSKRQQIDRNKRQRIRYLQDKLHAVRKKRKELDKKLINLEAAKDRIGGLISEMNEFSHSNNGSNVTMSQARIGERVDINQSTGIWIVRDREIMKNSSSVSLVKFYDLVNNVEKPLTLRVQLPKVPMIGEDGKEVTFNVGDLLSCAYKGDLHEGKHGFHFANVGPSGQEGQDMYDLVRKKMGLKIDRATIYSEKPRSDMKYIIVDGNFRKAVN